jgi:hypothetical protein
VPITLTVRHDGAGAETFSFSLTAPAGTFDGPQGDTLTGDTSATYSFTWNTQTVPPGDYVINASASTGPSEVNPLDNHASASVHVSLELRGALVRLLVFVSVMAGLLRHRAC